MLNKLERLPKRSPTLQLRRNLAANPSKEEVATRPVEVEAVVPEVVAVELQEELVAAEVAVELVAVVAVEVHHLLLVDAVAVVPVVEPEELVASEDVEEEEDEGAIRADHPCS
mmetsp:Transcript_117035/g.164507  ORF Transcript_117035/g.164507 Transcript_117035/m.164507 type:complete len:113 (+) Transcript_117035:463-801(+)